MMSFSFGYVGSGRLATVWFGLFSAEPEPSL